MEKITFDRLHKYEFHLTDEVERGIKWFQKITGEENILISTEPDKFVDLNEMNGSDFAFLFDGRKVLYYDLLTSAICTYCPKRAIKNRDYKSYKRIESNDKFNWILLYICTKEDLLSRFRLCSVSVQDEFGEEIYREVIDSDKVNTFFGEILVKAMEMSNNFVND